MSAFSMAPAPSLTPGVDKKEAQVATQQAQQGQVLNLMQDMSMIMTMSCSQGHSTGTGSCDEPNKIESSDGFSMITQLFGMSGFRQLEDTDKDYTCFRPPAADNKQADKPTINDITKACFKKELFSTGPLANRCIISQLSIIPNSYIDSFPVVTKDYDVFNPYTKPSVGQILKVKMFDCDTNKEIKIANQTADAIKVEMVGGDDCISFDETSKSFRATGIKAKSTKQMTIYEKDLQKFAAKNVTTCQSNHVGMFMVVNSKESQGLSASKMMFSLMNFLCLGMLFVMRQFYN